MGLMIYRMFSKTDLEMPKYSVEDSKLSELYKGFKIFFLRVGSEHILKLNNY